MSIANYEILLATPNALVHGTMRGFAMLTTGNQLRAARALAGLDQGTLAELADVNINTISAMEKRGGETLTSGLDVVTRVAQALEARGIEFLNHGEPGVRLRKGHKLPAAPAVHASKPGAGTKAAPGKKMPQRPSGTHRIPARRKP
jgi:DNA-binding XRE family transcriptional regulator